MALVPRFAFFVVLLLPYQCKVKAENCSETQCLLLPGGDDPVASEFHFKASENGVRLVYINLVIGDASYDPLDSVQDSYLPHRWVWANTIHDSMLSLPDDYDILSAGLLNFQVRSIDVKLKDHPSGCLAKLGSKCQNVAVGRMLLENVTSSISGDILHKKTPVVCVALINRAAWIVRYHCCDMHKEATEPATIRCDQSVDDNVWSTVVFAVFGLMSLFLAFYVPALPLALPDYVFSVKDEVEKENRLHESIPNPVTEGEQCNQRGTAEDQWNTERAALLTTTSSTTTTTAATSTTTHDNNTTREETGQNTLNCVANSLERGEGSEFIPVDDSSPMNLSTLLRECFQKFPNIPLSFNIKLAVMCLCVYPCVLYVQIGLYHTYKKASIDEIVKKHVLARSVFSRQILLVNETVSYDFLALQFLVMTLLMIFLIIIMILFSRPKHFFFEENELCELCRFISQRWRSLNSSLTSRCSLGDEIHHHFKILHHYVWYFTRRCGDILVFICKRLLLGCQREEMHQESLVKHLLYVCSGLITFIVALPLIVVSGVLCLLILIILLIFSLVVFSPLISVSMFALSKIVNRRGRNVGRERVVWDLLVPLCTAIFINFSFFLVVNSCLFVCTVVAYIIVGLALNVSIVTPFLAFLGVLTRNVYLCYTKMQGKYIEVKKTISERLQELHMNSNVPKGTIRAEIYWFVCDKVLPIKSEMCRMLRDMAVVIAFLFFALYSIVFFGNEYDISTWTKTIFVFFSGFIPPLFLKVLTKNSNIIGSAKIKIGREIDEAVTECRDRSNLEPPLQRIADA